MGIKNFQIKQGFPLIFLLTTITITFVAFFQVKNFGFIDWDDLDYIVNNPVIRDFSWNGFLKAYTYDRHISLCLMSFALDYKLFGLNPGAFHMVNIFIHLVNIVLVFLLARRFNLSVVGSLVIAVLFALHPMRTESVSWIMQRKDLLFTLFFISGLLIYIEFQKKGGRNIFLLILVFLCGYLSILSKIQAYAFPFTLFLLDYYFQRKMTFLIIVEKLLLFLFMIFTFLSVYQWVAVFISFFVVFAGEQFIVLNKRPFFIRTTNQNIYKYGSDTLLDIATLISIVAIIGFGFQFSGLAVSLMVLLRMGSRAEHYLKLKLSGKNIKLIITYSLILGLSISGIYLALLLARTSGYWHGGISEVENLWTRILFAGYSLSFYIIKFFVPVSLNSMHIYPDLLQHGIPLKYYLGSGVVLLLFITTPILLSKFPAHRKILIMGLLFFLLNIFPVLHIFPIEGKVIVANRYTYLAYFGLFLVTGYFVDLIIKSKHQRVVIICILIAAIIMGQYDYRISQNWRNSFTFWKDATEKDTDNYYAWFGLGNAYQSSGLLNEAMKAYNLSVTLNPRFEEVYNNRGNTQLALNLLDEANNDFNKAIFLKPDYAAAYNNRGIVEHRKGNFQKAAGSFTMALELSGTYPDASFNRGNAYLHLNVLDNAIIDFDEAILLDGSKAIYYVHRALLWVLKGNFTLAKSDNEAALTLESSNPIAIYNNGLIIMAEGDSSRANAEFQKALSISPELFQFFDHFGLAFRPSVSNYPKSPDDVQKAADLVNKAVQLGQSGNLAVALSNLNEAINLDPSNAAAWKNRGNVKVRQKDYSGAILDYSQSILLSPNDAGTYLNRGNAYFSSGNIQNACIDWNQASNMGNPRANEMLLKNCR